MTDLFAAHAEASMKDYYNNITACRRKMLMKSFEVGVEQNIVDCVSVVMYVQLFVRVHCIFFCVNSFLE